MHFFTLKRKFVFQSLPTIFSSTYFSKVGSHLNSGYVDKLILIKELKTVPRCALKHLVYCEVLYRSVELPESQNHIKSMRYLFCVRLFRYDCSKQHLHTVVIWFICRHRYSYLGNSTLESVQDFLIKLDIKPLMHLLEISTFSLNNFIVRLTKIMNRADKNWAHS